MYLLVRYLICFVIGSLNWFVNSCCLVFACVLLFVSVLFSCVWLGCFLVLLFCLFIA